MKINIVGSILGSSGYDSHCKQLAGAIYKINPDIKLDVPLTQDYLNHVNDAELDMIKKSNRIPDVTIAIMTPPQWRIALADQTKKFVGYCVWEGDKIPKYWIEYLMDPQVDQIWVPSQHTKDAITNTVNNVLKLKSRLIKDVVTCIEIEEKMLNKIKIVPHGVDTDLFIPKEKEDDGIFRFLCNKGWRGALTDRGGVQYLLKAFTEEFSKGEKIELNLHINPAYIDPASVKQCMDNLKLNENSPPIKVSSSNIPYKNLPALYQSADCYVCATRAESFDLGTAEAMACELPVITTGYGGQIEHMDETCADFINYRLEEVTDNIMYENICWAIPDIKHLQKLMRASFSQGLITKQKGVKARENISDWTWDNTAKKAIEFLKE